MHREGYLEWLAVKAVIPAITERLIELGVDARSEQVHVFLLGGGAPNVSQFIEQLEKLGYNSGACSYGENYDFWQKLGVGIELYHVICEAGA